MSRVPNVKLRGEETVFFDALEGGRVVFQRCLQCNAPVWYLRSVCPVCMGTRLAIEESAGLGAVYSFTTLERAGHPERAGDAPYSVVLVDLDEGIRMIGDFAPAATDDIIGARVAAAVVHEDAGARIVFSLEVER